MSIQRRAFIVVAIAAFALTGITASRVADAQQKAARPLTIVVYGGSGNIGSRIVNEAAARGHHVTVVDRSPKPELAPAGVKVVTGDVFDQQDVLKNIAGADAMVSSIVVRPAPNPDFALNVVKAEVAALRAQTGPKKTRLLVVGGGSSLYNAEGKRIIDTRPPRQDGEVKSSVDSLDYLLADVKDVQWTFFSPGGAIAPGTRTGKFRLGTDQLLVDANGKSAISMEDYAVAMVDEIEKPQFINRRFTASY